MQAWVATTTTTTTTTNCQRILTKGRIAILSHPSRRRMDAPDLDPHLIMLSWAHPGNHPTRHLDRFSHFCRAHERDQQTDQHTDRSRYSVCSNRPLSLDAMRLNNKNNACGFCWFALIIITRCSLRRQTSPPLPSPGKLDKMHASSLILPHSLHNVKMGRHPQNRKYIAYCCAVRGGPSHGRT